MKVLNDKLAPRLAAQNKKIQALQEKMKAQQSVVERCRVERSWPRIPSSLGSRSGSSC
jgi:hypothetical protein